MAKVTLLQRRCHTEEHYASVERNSKKIIKICKCKIKLDHIKRRILFLMIKRLKKNLHSFHGTDNGVEKAAHDLFVNSQ